MVVEMVVVVVGKHRLVDISLHYHTSVAKSSTKSLDDDTRTYHVKRWPSDAHGPRDLSQPKPYQYYDGSHVRRICHIRKVGGIRDPDLPYLD